MTWTTDTPTVPGWYWLQGDNGRAAEVVHVYDRGDQLCVYVAGYDIGDTLADVADTYTNAKWAGPLSPPKE